MFRLVPSLFVLLAPALVAAQTPLTLDAALDRARATSPGAQAARLRVDEARGTLAGARYLTENPTLAASFGRRLDVPPGGPRAEGSVELLQPLEIGGRRASRIRAAQAGLDAELAGGEAAVRLLESEVAVSFYRALAGRERERVARGAEEVAGRALTALERRYQLKDVALLDVNVARAGLARAQALVRAARAEALEAGAALTLLLGLDGAAPLELAGDLRDQDRFSPDRMLAQAPDRPAVRQLLAQAREAQGQAAAAAAERWPGVALGAIYERDDGANVVLGAVSLQLPLFQRGQGQRAAAEARARRLQGEADAARRSGSAALRTVHAAYQQRRQAAQALEAALPALDQTEELARKSHEAGQLSLAEWMVVRREAVDTRLEYVDQLLAAAEAGVALARLAGVSP